MKELEGGEGGLERKINETYRRVFQQNLVPYNINTEKNNIGPLSRADRPLNKAARHKRRRPAVDDLKDLNDERILT